MLDSIWYTSSECTSQNTPLCLKPSMYQLTPFYEMRHISQDTIMLSWSNRLLPCKQEILLPLHLPPILGHTLPLSPLDQLCHPWIRLHSKPIKRANPTKQTKLTTKIWPLYWTGIKLLCCQTRNRASARMRTKRIDGEWQASSPLPQQQTVRLVVLKYRNAPLGSC